VVDASSQAELDADMTVRCLPLHEQGLLSSYIPMTTSKVQNWGFSSRDTTYTESLITSLMDADKAARTIAFHQMRQQAAALETGEMIGEDISVDGPVT
jgi:hypothetical protein